VCGVLLAALVGSGRVACSLFRRLPERRHSIKERDSSLQYQLGLFLNINRPICTRVTVPPPRTQRRAEARGQTREFFGPAVQTLLGPQKPRGLLFRVSSQSRSRSYARPLKPSTMQDRQNEGTRSRCAWNLRDDNRGRGRRGGSPRCAQHAQSSGTRRSEQPPGRHATQSPGRVSRSTTHRRATSVAPACPRSSPVRSVRSGVDRLA
jgi:hypothetical protein